MINAVDIQAEYRTALMHYISNRGEDALQQAYEIGRSVIAEGGGCLDVHKLHQETLISLIATAETTAEISNIVLCASKFFAESLSPFEMTHRGFQDSIEALKVQALDLASMNAHLGTEIAEREQAEEKLRSSEELYRTLVDTARDVIYTLSIDGVITSLNPAFEMITGWERAAWVGKHFTPMLHPDDIPIAGEKMAEVLKGKNPAVIELRVRAKSGDFIVGEFISTPQFDQERVVGVLGIARDITARKRTEELLRQNEEEFRLITENIADLIVVLDTQGRRLYNSPSYKTLLPNPKSARGIDSFDDVHPDDRPRVKEIFYDTVRTGIGQRTEYRFVLRDGSIRNIESQGSVIRNSEGTTEKVIVVSRDITARKLAEEKLQKSEMQLAAAQQIAHVGSWEWDVASNRIHWSDELYRIYGVSPSEFVPTSGSYLERIFPEDRERIRDTVRESLKARKPFQFEHRIAIADGTIRIVEARGEVVLDGDGVATRMVGTSQDVTERKKSTEAVRALAKRVVEAQEEERRRIARELHDNICQQLSGLKMDMGALEEEVSNRRTRLFKQLHRLTGTVGKTMKDVRGLSANLRPATLDDLGLSNALQLLCREFEKQHGIKVQFDGDGVSKAMLDIHKETALYRIAQESLMNVAKHAHAKIVNVKLVTTGSTIAMTIRDNGRGFDPDGQRQRKENSGHGLINMQERSQLLGGSFRIVSTQNKGTSVHLEIPLVTR